MRNPLSDSARRVTEAARWRLAVVVSHPIQYFSPWFRQLASHTVLDLKVFYLWDFGVASRRDEGFGHDIVWDIPLLDGYAYEFVPNHSRRPGTHRFFGLDNPAIVDRLVDFAPDAILMFGYNYASMLRILFSRRLRKVPLVFRGDSHRLVARRGAREALRRRLIGRAFGRFDAVLPVGTANREYFLHHGVPEGKLFHAPHAVDNERFASQAADAAQGADRFRESLGIPPGNAVILFAGKFESVKGPLDLLRAFVRAQLPDTTLLLVGAGVLEQELREEARGRNDIVFAPFQNQSMMPTVYSAADVLVLPSESETWGLAVNEAMCMSRAAIVSSHVGCAPDLVIADCTGLVFRAGDVDELAAALKRALSDRARLRQWGLNARARVADFSYERATDGLLKALASCARARSPA